MFFPFFLRIDFFIKKTIMAERRKTFTFVIIDHYTKLPVISYSTKYDRYDTIFVRANTYSKAYRIFQRNHSKLYIYNIEQHFKYDTIYIVECGNIHRYNSLHICYMFDVNEYLYIRTNRIAHVTKFGLKMYDYKKILPRKNVRNIFLALNNHNYYQVPTLSF